MENTEENCEKIWKIWKKGNLKSEMIWKIWKISVLVIITPKETTSSSLYILFFRIEKNYPGIGFLLETASRDQIYHFIHLALRNSTVRTRTPLKYYTKYPKTP
jgi:hypothetical protein